MEWTQYITKMVAGVLLGEVVWEQFGCGRGQSLVEIIPKG